MSILDWAWFMAKDMQALPKHRKRVSDREKAGLCLDNRDGCECGEKALQGRVGLCGSHFWKRRIELIAVPPSKRDAYDKQRVLSGTMLPPRSGKGGGRPRKKKAGAA